MFTVNKIYISLLTFTISLWSIDNNTIFSPTDIEIKELVNFFLDSNYEKYLTDIKKYTQFFAILDPNYDHNTIKIKKFLENQRHSYVFFIEDANENPYIVKQDRSFSSKHQIFVVLEKLAAYIADKIGISSQKVEILPAGVCFPGKAIAKRPASIHTCMPGVTIRELTKGPFSHISIKQGGNPKESLKYLGINEKVIKSMSEHEDLPPIVALDTFTGNRDRNQGNLIYDELNNKFYSIDMGVIYDVLREDRVPIAMLACKNIESMIHETVSFTQKELCALDHYRSVLLKLLENFPPDKTYFLLCLFAREAGLLDTNTKFKSSMFQSYKIAIEETYYQCEHLIDLLSQLLKSKNYKKSSKKNK